MTSDFVAALPSELVIKIFAFLDPACLTRCTAVSRGWKSLIENDLIWHKVATEQLGLCPAAVEVQDLATLPSLKRWSASGHLANLTSFRQLCVRWQQVLYSWRGSFDPNEEQDVPHSSLRQSRSKIRKIQATSKFIQIVTRVGLRSAWYIKADPEEGVLIVIASGWGLYVLDIKTNQVLTQLSIEQVGAYEHLEGERGILVINDTRTAHGDFDVWVHRRLVLNGGNGDIYQRRNTLRPSQCSYVSRFKWPVFCTMGVFGTAFFWDLSDPEQPRHLISIDISAFYYPLGLDFDDQHLFMAGESLGAVTVYDRATGQVKWSLAAHLRQADAHSLIRSYKLDFSEFLEDADQRSSPFELCERQLLGKRHLNDKLDAAINRLGDATPGDDDDEYDRPEWVAIHPDEGTGALLVLGRTMLAIIPDFASLTESNCRAPIMMIEYTGRRHYSPYADSRMQRSLAVADGRAFVVMDCPIVLDLAPQRKAPLTPGSAPFRLSDDPDTPPPLRIFAGRNPFIESTDVDGARGCISAQMDAANLFAAISTRAPVDSDGNFEGYTPFEILHWRIDGA
ncbi:unnamed protein product [Tilletia laevis]|uniref:F-box domain-containing protein n=3 Tax=Tilletia TaxID=13289 RepID=A0A8X7SU89_9BASI|nr:hypothetical protein CF336_g6736 [Tilletia laevis]KAE8242038.1 hypothetical protein A4X06_0g7291 [Tilletia controversa]KAE8252210.1 hypothetical protein A4X03_0g6229 [Tilletia caries]KAE8190902.1 hypothetical protein CF335_g6233 [Tilletia laevis]CAD6897739.1 unnamed protein product [Tilletia laevis]